MENKRFELDISLRSLLRTTAIVLFLFFLYYISDILLLVFLAFFLATLIEPLVDYFQAKKIPRALGIIVIYIFMVLLLAALVWLITPPIVDQFSQLLINFPDLWNRFTDNFAAIKDLAIKFGLYQNLSPDFGSVEIGLTRAATGVYGAVSGIFKGLFDIIFVLVLAFYLVLEHDAASKVFRALVPIKHLPRWVGAYEEIKDKVGQWARGQLLLGLIIGSLVFIGLIIFVPKYALILAIIAGTFEMVPYFGPILSAIPAIFLGLMVPNFSLRRGIMVLILFIIIQWSENNLIYPQVMKKKVGISPVLTIVSMLISVRVFGIIGIVLAVPLATALTIIVREFFRKPTGAEKSESQANAD